MPRARVAYAALSKTAYARAYIKAFKKEFYTMRKPRVQHIRKPRFTNLTNNNIMERLNGTVREREKVMRSMKGDETAEELMNGFRTYYNFIRPHTSLNARATMMGFVTSAEIVILTFFGDRVWSSVVRSLRTAR